MTLNNLHQYMKIDKGDSFCIFSGPKIQIAQPKDDSTARFREMTGIPYYSYCYYY